MDKRQRDKFKKLLLKQRSDILSEIEHLKDSALKKSQREASGDLSGYLYHMADAGTDNYDREFNLGLASNENKLLYEIDETLKRIDEKTFGKCEGCGEHINAGRLKAVPYARFCIQCKEREEQKQKAL